jgi:bla regulator protein BlaR1
MMRRTVHGVYRVGSVLLIAARILTVGTFTDPQLSFAQSGAPGEKGRLASSHILHAVGDRPSFEVATIKPWKRTPSPPPLPDGANLSGATSPVKVMKVAPLNASPPPTDRLHMILPISVLITSAYNLSVGSDNRLIGGPDWLRQDIDQFEIQAKIEDSEYAAMQKMIPAQQHERVALMEQSLLADRFKLRVHFEAREMRVYALEIAKNGEN